MEDESFDIDVEFQKLRCDQQRTIASEYRELMQLGIEHGMAEDHVALKQLNRFACDADDAANTAQALVQMGENSAWPTAEELRRAIIELATESSHVKVEGGRLKLTRYIHPRRNRPLMVIEFERPYRFTKDLLELVLEVCEKLGGGIRERWNGKPGHDTMSIVFNEPFVWPDKEGRDAP